MAVIKFIRDIAQYFKYPSDENPTTQQDYQNAVKNWVATETSLVDAILWQPTTEYSAGNLVKTPSIPSQYALVCTEGGLSGATEPDYTGVNLGDTVTDGTVTWLIDRIATKANIDALTNVVTVNAADVISLAYQGTTYFSGVSGTLTVIGGHIVIPNVYLQCRTTISAGTKDRIGDITSSYAPKYTCCATLAATIASSNTTPTGFTWSSPVEVRITKMGPASYISGVLDFYTQGAINSSDGILIGGMYWI